MHWYKAEFGHKYLISVVFSKRHEVTRNSCYFVALYYKRTATLMMVVLIKVHYELQFCQITKYAILGLTIKHATVALNI